jgi:integrase
MPTLRLTAQTVQSLKPKPQRVDYFDATTPGFGLRLTPGGVKTWFFMYRVNGKRLRRWTIGRYPTLSLADAREKMKIASGDLAKGGIDPAATKIQSRTARTIDDLAAEYLTKHAMVKKKSWRADDWQLKKDILPAWRYRPVQDIKRLDVVALLDDIADPNGRNAPQSAVHVRRLLSKMFNFALARDYGIEYNPVQGTDPPAHGGRRTRVLDGREIGALEHGLDRERDNGYALTAAWQRLILLTGQRPGEVLAMEWNKLELGKREGWWTVRMSKNGDPIRAALSVQAVACLRELAKGSRQRHEEIERNMEGRRERREFSQFVFPAGARARSRTTVGADGEAQKAYEDRHMSGTLHNACERIRENAGIDDYNPHDLRRTAGTTMAELGVPRFIIERVLNHTDRTVTSVYDRYSYSKEKMAAVTKLGAYVQKMAKPQRSRHVA